MPFEDTPNTVIERLLDLTDEQRSEGPGPRPQSSRAVIGTILPEGEHELPILQALIEAGGRGPAGAVTDRVGELLSGRLTSKDYDRHRSGDIRWRNQTAFTRLTLVRRGLLVSGSPRGVWEITEEGRLMIVEGLDLVAVQRFFDAEVPDVRGPLRAELIPGGRSNLTYRLTDGHSSWVLRRPPLGGLTPSAHDMAREYQVVAGLADTSVPVPRAVVLGRDPAILGMQFSVFEYVPGRVIRTRQDLHALPDPEIARCAYGLIDVLVGLHAVDPDAVGLSGFGRPEGYLARQIRRWHDQWTRVRTRALPDIETLHIRLAGTCPAESGASIVHGDYRIDNAILDAANAGTVRALVDWEMATLGDPLADLGLHLVYADPAFGSVLDGSAASTSERLPPPEDLAQRYALISGRDLRNLAFYRGLGYFKIAVIAEGIHARYVRGLTLGEGFENVGHAVPLLAAAGVTALAGWR